MTQFELLSEIIYEHLDRKVEPVIYFFEAIKVLLRVKEYSDLITKERMGCYISKERYEEHKKDEEKKNSMLMLPRSKKYLPKPENFSFSNKMINYALKSVNSIDSLQSLDDGPGLRKFNSNKNEQVEQQSHQKKKPGFFRRFLKFFTKKFSKFVKIVKSRKFHNSEILIILRPFIYMWFLLK